MTTEEFVFRQATPADVPDLARLHVAAFVETHGGPGPAYELRERQWREAFAKANGNWFCYVIESRAGQLVGFAKGVSYTDEVPGFGGELNKLYLLRKYYRRGLGRRLIGHVTRRFLMLLFGDARNPSNGFYEALEAERLVTASGEFHGGYGWWDLRKLGEMCPVE